MSSNSSGPGKNSKKNGNKAVQSEKVDLNMIEMALACVNSLSDISEISKTNDKESKDGIWEFFEEVQCSLKEFKSITNPESALEVSGLATFITDGKLKLFVDIISLGAYMEDVDNSLLKKQVQSLVNCLKTTLMGIINGHYTCIANSEFIQKSINEIERILDLWKGVTSKLQESDKLIKDLHAHMLSCMQTKPLLLYRIESNQIQHSYSACVTGLSIKLASLSNELCQLGSSHTFTVSMHLHKLFSCIKSEIIPLVDCVLAFHKWNLSSSFGNFTVLATLIDWCSHISVLQQEKNNIHLDNALSYVLFMLESMHGILPSDCSTLVSRLKQDKSILLKEHSSIMNFLLTTTNMKEYYNDHLPNFYQIYAQFYENCINLQACCQDSWIKTGTMHVDGSSIKDLNNLLSNFILELRKDFFMAKGRFYSIYTANPNEKYNVISLCKDSIQHLQSISSLLPQNDTSSLTQDANFIFSVCSDISDGLIMLAGSSNFSQDLSLFFEALYAKQQVNLLPLIQHLLKGVTSILEEEMFLQSQRQLQGHLHSDRKEFFDIHFFVLLNLENWNFTDENFTVALHFYNNDQISSTNFVSVEMKEKCVVMTSKVTFHKKYLGRKIYYKYWIVNPNVNLEELLYIHEAKGDDCDSCFRVRTLPSQDHLSENSYSIYDPPVYPRQLKVFYQRWFSGTIFKEPDRKKEGEICFLSYLSAYFSQNQLSHDDVNAFYLKLTRVYDSLMSSKKVNIHNKEISVTVLNVTGETTFKRILTSESDKLLKNQNPHCILQYIILCHFLIHNLKSLSGDLIDTMLSSLQVMYDGVSFKKCSQYDIIIKFQDLDLMKKLIAEIFLAIGKCLLFPKSGSSLVLFLKALPLYHWFVDPHPTRPFAELDVKPDSIKELIKSSEYLCSKKAWYNQEYSWIMQSILVELKSLDLEGDAKLQAILFVICPPAQYSVLLNYVSLPVILIGINLEMKNTDEKSIEKLLKEVKSEHSCSGATEALTDLVLSLQGKIQKSSKSLITVCIKTMLTLTKSHQALRVFSGVLQKLACIHMESQCFGGNNCDQSEKEHKFWLNFIKCDEDSEEWKTIIGNLIYGRVKKIQKFPSLISVFKSMFRQDKDDPIVKVVTTVIEETTASPTFNQKELTYLSSHPSKLSKSLFSHCLDKKYPNPECISIESILEYEMWPAILTSYSGSDGEGFSELSHSLFQKLLAVMEHSQHCMISGISSVNFFKMMERRWNDHLCPILRSLKLQVDVNDFKKAMDSANNRIVLFQFHEALLLNFSNYLKGLKKDFEVCEISPLVIDDMHINELCVEDDEKSWKYPSLQAADPVKPLLIPCAIMTSKELENDIFHQQCKDQVKRLNSADTWSEIADAVEAAFESCNHILMKLRKETISLHEVDTLFRNKGVIVPTLSRLENALMFSKISKNSLEAALDFSFQKTCSLSSFFTKSMKTTPASWINEVATSIALWKGVSPLLMEAQNFVDILHDFEVEPDEFIAFSEMDLDTTELKSVARQKKEILEFMKKTNEQTREVKDSIKKFAKNKELREWILAKSEDLNAMETFIGVVLDTLAEGGDEIQDKLTNLLELCSKFSSLIYHFDKTKSKTKSLKKVFEDTYKKLSDLSDPAALVEICSNDFEWYKRIGELQGSIEQGAVTQMKNINQHGFYSIQSLEDFHKCKVELSIVWDKEHVVLSIDDLNELESKLVLITRKNSAWAAEKELFQEMLKRIILISESVQKLKDFGHLEYLDWEKKYHCPEYIRDLGSLDQEICNLGSILVGWIYNVWKCRYQFPELNYYTTEQLIVLRKELTSIKNDPSKEVNPQVFYLLHSVIGEPVDSTMLLKKGLKCDEKFDTIQEDTEEDNAPSSSIKFAQRVDSLVSADDAVSLNASDTADDNISVLQEAINNLNEEETKVYSELVSCGYDDYMCVEAAILHNDIYNAIEWCDRLDEEKEETLQKKYFPIQTTAISSSSVSFSPDCSLTVSEQNPIKISVMPDVVHFDVTPIVSMFVSSDIYSAFNVPMDDKKIMSLNDLGDFLREITELRGRKQIKRSFSEHIFEKGHPNLIVTSADEIFNCVIQIYAEDEDAPLPCYEEILLCSSNTTLEQVVVFWMRALFDQNPGRIYCLVHAEKLSYLVADKAIDLLSCLSQGISDYRLVIVCSNESEGKSHVLTRLNSYHRNWGKNDDSGILKKYLKKHLIPKINDRNINASIIDEEKSLVRIIYSKQAAAGKSHHIRKMKDRLNAVLKEKDLLIGKKKPKVMLSIPLHGPDVTPDEVLKMLLAEKNVVKSCIIHIDVPQQVLHSIDDILFSIIILQGLSDSRGQIWRCRSTHFYAIEMTIPSRTSYIRKFTQARRALSLLHLVPNKECYQPLEIIGKIDEGDLTDLRTPMYQRVYKYLKLLDLRKYQELEKFQYIGTLEDTDKECLETIIKHCGTTNPTWKEIRHFVWFLNHQLSACEQSNVIRTVKGLKEFTVKFMIDMSRDFATSSMPNGEGNENLIKQHNPRQNWEHSLHPYLFFNKNRKSVTHVGLALNGLEVVEEKLHFQYKFSMKISPEVERFLSLKVNVPKISQQKIVSQRNSIEGSILLKRLVNFMNIPIEDGEEIISPDVNYVLTQDNLTKIMGIQTRFRCQIPVVLMGETGCGKTHLIRFMCKVAAYDKNIKNMFIIKIHGGTTEEDVIKCLEEAESKALIKNRKEKVDTVVFFDEANTSDVISLIKEIMCDGKCRGKPVPPFLKFVAACNPYRCHSDAMIKQLKGAGLGWRDKEPSRATEKLGEIPLRNLVYRVLKIPDSLKALVYDFGKLDSSTERDYIYQIVYSRLQEEINEKEVIHAIAHVLAECQKYLKDNEDECSFVSLRDVERAMIFFKFFYKKFIALFSTQRKLSKTTESLLLALTVSYFARLDSQDVDGANSRTKFEDHICSIISTSNKLKCVSAQHGRNYRLMLSQYQDKLLDCMSIEENIARNAALKENLFMMFVCIQLRVPLFLVGKPGSSKSLAKTIIQTSMRGQNSKNETLKQFNHVHLHSYQCSELSTAGSIKDVFYSAVKYQEKRRKNDSSFVSVVVLDEVGLAEASPYLPLKSLHPLLEDGTEGTGSTDKRVKREDRVAFVGISNWALDPAKMNRGILVRRSEPSIKDLIDSAKGICSDKTAESLLSSYFDKLARAYHEIFKNQPKEFFGLRDYYSLIKMLHWMTQQTGTILTVPQLRHAIKRNFSGYTDFDPYKCFLKKLPELDENIQATNLMKRLHNNAVVLLKCEKSKSFLAAASSTTLILTEKRDIPSHFVIHCETQSGRKKLFTFQSLYYSEYFIAEYRGKLTLKKGRCYFSVKEVKSHGIQLISMAYSKPAEFEDEANFFPVHPENSIAYPDCSPRGLIRESLINKDTSKHGESRYLLFLTDNYSSLQILKHYIMSSYSKSNESNYEPFVLFGSSFPKDRDFAQVCRNISEIRLCMETGRMLILLNLENLYESLYDLLNQYYIKSGRHRYVDLGLRTHRMKCSVHENFKLILIAEKKKVHQDFPTPLVNRLEKHFINNETVLEDWQKTVVDDIEKWITSFMTDNDRFKKEDAFVGYNSDTKAAVVLQASTQFQMSKNTLEKEKMVLQLSKKLLLQMATPDAVIRALKKDTEESQMFLRQVYFYEQEHSSLVGLLQRISWHHENTFLLQVTSHSLPMYQKEIHSLKEFLKIDEAQLERDHIEAFETEYEFLASVDAAIEKGKINPFYQIYECEFGQDNGNLISCCRYRLVDKIKGITKEKSSTLFVLIVHLPRKCDNMDFISFQEYPWVCYHVDELIPSEESRALLRQISCQSNHLSHLFLSEGTDPTADELFNAVTNDSNQYFQLFPLDEAKPVNLCSRVHTYIADAVSQLDQSEKIQSSQKIKKLESLISTNAQKSQTFYSVTIALMKRVLEKMDDCQQWVFEEAINLQHLQEGGSFSNVLIRRFNKTLKPLFILIIRFIDRHSNLQLLKPDCLDENDKSLTELWLDIYSSQELCQSTLFKILASQKHEKMDQKIFQCSFPFSWIVYEYINKKIDDDNAEDVLQNFELQECFKSLPPALFKEFAAFYAHDFVFLLRSSEATHYCELVAKALLTMSYDAVNDESNFIEILVQIHSSYFNSKECFECFLDLAVEMPSIVRAIIDRNETISDISSLIVVVLEGVLNSIHLDEKVPLKGTAALRGWMQKMYQLQAVIDNIFNNLDLENCHKLKKQWQRLCVMKLFMEHVVVDHEDDLLTFATRLDKYSDKIEDYQGPQILKSVSTLLIAVEDFVMKKIGDKTKQVRIKESCWNFFVDVLLNFCDSDNTEVLEILVASVFSDASEIPKLHTYIQRHPENLPFLHSFTIKLILSQDLSMANDHLLKIEDCIAASSSSQAKISINSFFALVINYLKIETHEKRKPETSEIVYCTDNLLSSSCETLVSSFSNGDMTSPECLLAVAQLIYSCQLLAKTVADEDYRSLNNPADVEYFYNKADSVFQETELNDDTDKSGPLFFFIRFVVRRYGISVLTKLMELQSQQFSWVLSSKIDIDDFLKERQFINYGAMYQPQYQEFYEAISEATTSTGDFKALEKICNSATSVSNLVPLIMALQYRIQLSYVSSTPSNGLSSDKMKALHKFIKQCKHFNSYPEISKCIEEIVVKNCSKIPEITVSKEDSFETIIFRTVLVHSVLTVQANWKSPLISILHTLLTSPNTLQGCMLPGMPCSTNTSNVSKEVPSFPECKKGHKFPSTMVDISCPECGNIIQSPQAVDSQSIPPSSGYVPVAIGCETPPFGYLNGISYSIIRCIIHCILLWATHDGKNVGQLLHGKIDDPKKYFWVQIETDINDLAKALSCSMEEASFIIHFVLKKINEKGLQVVILPNIVKTITQLRSIADREQWEGLFHQSFIAPVLEDFEAHLLKTISKMHLDTDYSALFDSVYMAPKNVNPFLWEVYPEPTLEYLRHGLMNFQLKDTNPVLFTLITEGSCINATKHISDIIALQKKLSQNKVDEKTRFEDFVQLLDDKEKENYEALVKSLTIAWSSCRHCLMNSYDRLNTTEAIKIEEITDDTPMKFLLPTTSGPGVLSTALVDHLVIVHNNFINLCREFVEKNLNKRWMWEAHKVSLIEMDSSLHAVNCDVEKLRELVTTHSVFIANPSGTIGIQYMLDNLEKDIVQQYVLGKPIIIDTLNIPTVTIDVKLRQVIALITKNIEQSPLPFKVKSDFRSDLKTVPVIVGICEVLEVAMKFLSKKSAPKTMKLKEYIEVDLLMKERIRSKKIMEYCNLEHVIGLWRFLQVECARVKNRLKINLCEHVRKQFRSTLKSEAKTVLEKAAHKVSDLDYLIEMLFEFIHTYVQYCDVNDSKKPLSQFFKEFLKQTGSKIISDLDIIFPPSVLLSQVTDCWKCLADFEDSIKKFKSY